MKSVEENPRDRIHASISKARLFLWQRQNRHRFARNLSHALTMGSWDSTALLRANLEQVKKTAAKLPYMSSFAG